MSNAEIEDVLIMGAGAVGGYFGAMIDRHTDARVYYIARGAHLEAMLLHGLKVKSGENTFHLQVTASDDPSSIESVDLVILAVKSHDTPQAIDQLRPVVTEDTWILTLQNGIENYSLLTEAFGTERVIQGFCRIGASVPEPGVVYHSSLGSVTIGNPETETAEPHHRRVQELFRQADIDCSFSENIQHDLWGKFAWNCIFNMLTTVAFVKVDQLFGVEEAEQLCFDLFDEIAAVAEVRGVELTQEDAHNIIDGARQLTNFKTSTYQDREKGKAMEYEAFTGSVVRLAKKHGIAVPRNQTLYTLLKLIDQYEINQ